MSSTYLTWLRIWSVSQLSLGAAVWAVTTISLMDSSLGSEARLNGTLWQAISGGVFSWGLVLLAIYLAVAALGDFMSQMSSRMFDEPPTPSNRTEPAKASPVNRGNESRFSKHASLSTAEREAWRAAGEPDLSTWDGKSPLSTWLSKTPKSWGD